MKFFLEILFFILLIFTAALLSAKLSIDHSFRKAACKTVITAELPSVILKNTKQV